MSSLLRAKNNPCLPSAVVLYSFRKWSPGDSAKFEGVGAHFQHIVDDGTKSSRRIHGRKQNHIAKLDKHLEVVIIRALDRNVTSVRNETLVRE
jgi:hypothetical protein